MRKIILASGSPRRKEILELLGIDFEVAESFFDEDKIVTDDPVELVEELALQKALTVAERFPDDLIIAGDTTVYVEGEILGKAANKSEAKKMMGKLLGKSHRVLTGVAVVNPLTNESYVGHEEGVVTLRSASQVELDMYADKSSNWKGFAGAYAIQGGAAPFVLNQSGKLSAIIGLPVELTCHLLEQAGEPVEADPKEVEVMLATLKVGIEDQ